MPRLPLPKNPNDLDVEHLHQIGKDILERFPTNYPPKHRKWHCFHCHPTKGELHAYYSAKKLAEYPKEEFIKQEGWMVLVRLLKSNCYVFDIDDRFSRFNPLGEEMNRYIESAWPIKVADFTYIDEYQTTLGRMIGQFPFTETLQNQTEKQACSIA